MAKKPATPEKSRSKNNSKFRNKDYKITSINSRTPTKNKDGIRNRINEIAVDDASSEEIEVLVAPSSSTESPNDNVVEFGDSEEDGGGEERSLSDEEEEERKRTPKSIGKKGKKEESKSKGKKRIKKEEGCEEEAEEKTSKKKAKKEEVKNKGKKRRKEEDDEEETEEKSANALYTFPMNRVKSIIRNEIQDLRITSEALFLINKASEKFLQLLCREAYACAFLDPKNYTAYNHLSSVVSKRKRLEFLSDFVPEKVKAKDALAQIAEAEK